MVDQTDSIARAPQSHSKDFAPLAVSARNLHRWLAVLGMQHASHREVAATVFEGRPSRYTVKAWRIGKRFMPPWAREMLADRGRRIVEAANEIPAGPGSRAGIKNLKRWR